MLSFIVAPAILTNASSLLAMSTSNRLARAVDRARELSKQLEASDGTSTAETDRRLRELGAAETRAIMLIKALGSFYTALGGFALAALVSLIGAGFVSSGVNQVVPVIEIVAVAAGVVAVGTLVHGSVLLVRETRIAVQVLRERASGVRARMGGAGTVASTAGTSVDSLNPD
jgi:type IV secretory pathway VirB6-like protein